MEMIIPVLWHSFNDKNTFYLQAQSHQFRLNAILCQKGNLLNLTISLPPNAVNRWVLPHPPFHSLTTILLIFFNEKVHAKYKVLEINHAIEIHVLKMLLSSKSISGLSMTYAKCSNILGNK